MVRSPPIPHALALAGGVRPERARGMTPALGKAVARLFNDPSRSTRTIPAQYTPGMTIASREHWQGAYTTKGPTAVSWYQAVPERSLALIRAAARAFATSVAGKTSDADTASLGATRVIDVGGGASTLVDHLAAETGVEVCVVDLAAAALEHARARLSPAAAARVRFVEADVTGPLAEIETGWADVWHDRAVFHFLTTPEARLAYARNLARVLSPGGTAIIATFAPDGPEKCSGLAVCRHDGASIAAELSRSGRAFTLMAEQREEHATPWGSVQQFVYAVLKG